MLGLGLRKTKANQFELNLEFANRRVEELIGLARKKNQLKSTITVESPKSTYGTVAASY